MMVLKGCDLKKYVICISVFIFIFDIFVIFDLMLLCADSSRHRGKCVKKYFFSVLRFGVVSCIVLSD